MNQARDRSPLPLPDVIKEDLVNGPQKRDGLGSNHVVHIHVDPILCNSLGPSSFCKTHPNLSDSHSVKTGPDLAKSSVGSDSEALNSDSSLEASGSLKGSIRCPDSAYDDLEEVRPGFFDYMPSQSGHVKIADTFNSGYSEEVKQDCSTGSWNFESAARENHVIHDELNQTEPPQSHTKHKHICWDYTSVGKHSEDEDMEDEEDERDRRGASSNSCSFLPSFPRTSQTQVDECVSYNLKPLKGSGTGHNHQRNTPLLYNMYQDKYISDGNKEKDKKNKSKDDSDKSEVSDQVDVNGNPRSLDPASYLQMRQWPRGKSEHTASGSLSSYTPITIPQSHSSFGNDTKTFDRRKERRRMKLERLKGTPAEEYKGYRKFTDIKDILAFVEGSSSSAKGDIKSAKKRPERSRKRDHQLNGSLALDETVAGEDVTNKEESLVVTHDLRPAPKAMGNSFRRPVGGNSISKTWSEDDDVDKSSNEFHDCLNSFPAELIKSEAELAISKREHLVGRTENTISKIAPSFTETDKSDSSSTGDSITEKHLTDNNKIVIKKSTKTKSTEEKQDATSNNRPLSLKSKMLKTKDRLEIKDSVLVTSVTNHENMKLGAIDKDLILDVKREDSFTEVKKRKKRPVGKDLNSVLTGHAFSLSYHSLSKSGHPHHNKSRIHKHTPTAAPVVSSIAIVSSSSSLTTGSKTHASRDLSPSAFPVLSGQDSQVIFRTDARRNSCGDLHSDSVDNKTYDSDRESAKSLPPAHGARVGGDISPGHPVSYARIAAAPPKNDSTNSPNSESSVGSICQNTQGNSTDSVLPQSPANLAVTPERKATVWKGSPRERRHSIGSSPEDKAEGERFSVAERNRQSGSQEVLRSIVTLVSAPPNDVIATSTPVKQICNSENPNSFLLNPDLQKMFTPVTKFISDQGIQSVFSAQEAIKSLSQNARQKLPTSLVASTEYATTSISSNSQAVPSIATFQPSISSQASHLPVTTSHPPVTTVPSGTPEKEEVEINARKDKKEVSAHSFLTNSIQSATATCPTDSSSNTVFIKNKLTSGPDVARKSNNTKSVIFMDKRFSSSLSQNLGITFGFDSSCESKSESTSQHTNQQPQSSFPSQPVVPSSLSQSSSIDTSVQPSYLQHLPHPAFSQEHSHIPLAAQTVTTLPDSQLSSNSASKSSDDNNSQLPKDPHINRPRNGLILPSNPAGNSSIPQYQLASSGISSNNNISINNSGNSINACNDSSNPCLITSMRTNHSEVKTGNISSSNIISLVNSDPGLSSLSSVALENNPLDQVNTSIPHIAMESTGVTIIQTNPTGVTPSLNNLPPPLSQTAATEDINNKYNSALLPLALEKKESISECQGISGLTESTLRESACNPSSLTKEEEIQETLETPVTASTATAAPTEETESQQQPLLVAPEMLPVAKSVVYGLMIKPGVGCGKVLFVPSNVSKKNKGNSAEIGSFLRKKWLHDVIHTKGSGRFVTLAED